VLIRAALLLVLLGAGLANMGWEPVAGRSPEPVRVIAFSGIPTVPLHVARSHSIFARHGLSVEVEITPNSAHLREGLAAGKYDIAHAAVDNAVALVESGGTDVVIVLGGDDSMNELVVQPGITSIQDLRGRTVIVDAPNTAYALQLRHILAQSGLRPSDYELKVVGGTPLRLKAMLADPALGGTMLNPPFSLQATRSGLRSLGSARELLGPYQGMGAFVRRDWGRANADTLVRYLRAFVEAQRWFMAPENADAAREVLQESLQLDPEIAAATYARGLEGLAPDARLDVEGLKHVLQLRATVEGQWDGRPPAPTKYYDSSYYDAALASQ
jgi:ABC-type nitrate/sulfonate/bicarbonate transport system substrate-binding protein